MTSPWNLNDLYREPQVYAAPEFSEHGVSACFFDGEPYHGKPTRVFAWYGLPEGAENKQVPGMVLVHGGGGTAFAEWVRLWTSRGYAAIAMDTCGSVPGGEYGSWSRHEWSGPAGWGGFDQVDEPLDDQWTHHAVASVIRGHSLLRSMPQVDQTRIGMTGISWGGYLTCIAGSLDTRLRFAAPVYGCGFIGQDSCWLETFADMGALRAEKWLSVWDPSVYLSAQTHPMLWVTGTNDFAYPMNSLQDSYRLPSGPRTLAIRVEMPHGHHGPGENPEEIRVFADHHLMGGIPLPVVVDQGSGDDEAWVRFASQSQVVGAELNYTCDTGKWQERKWHIIPAELEPAGSARARIPAEATAFYLNLVDSRNCVVSAEHQERQ